ncbi:MAG: AraC family transcriptional regulator [Bosea sp.]|nr:AraC family transcriptional regulator [Bosea sp. (in: a-proteobacteria)]
MSEFVVNPEATQRIGVACELTEMLAGFGVDGAALFGAFGLDPAALTPDTRLPFRTLLTLLDRAATLSGCEHLGVLCGLRFRLDHHGRIGALMRSGSTLRQALEDFVTWQPGYSSGAIVYLHRREPDNAFGYGCYAGTAAGTRVLYDAILGVGIRMVRELAGPRANALEFQVAHRAPSDAAIYARLLGAPVRFNRHETCLILDDALLDTRLPGADAAARRRMLDAARQDGRWAGASFSMRVRHELRRALVAEEPLMAHVADEIGISARTLRRRLDEEGTTFEALRDEVRRAVARELLELTDLPLGEIATILGFASPGVFSEAFRRAAGTTPSLWRRERRPAAALA